MNHRCLVNLTNKHDQYVKLHRSLIKMIYRYRCDKITQRTSSCLTRGIMNNCLTVIRFLQIAEIMKSTMKNWGKIQSYMLIPTVVPNVPSCPLFNKSNIVCGQKMSLGSRSGSVQWSTSRIHHIITLSQTFNIFRYFETWLEIKIGTP